MLTSQGTLLIYTVSVALCFVSGQGSQKAASNDGKNGNSSKNSGQNAANTDWRRWVPATFMGQGNEGWRRFLPPAVNKRLGPIVPNPFLSWYAPVQVYQNGAYNGKSNNGGVSKNSVGTDKTNNGGPDNKNRNGTGNQNTANNDWRRWVPTEFIGPGNEGWRHFLPPSANDRLGPVLTHPFAPGSVLVQGDQGGVYNGETKKGGIDNKNNGGIDTGNNGGPRGKSSGGTGNQKTATNDWRRWMPRALIGPGNKFWRNFLPPVVNEQLGRMLLDRYAPGGGRTQTAGQVWW